MSNRKAGPKLIDGGFYFIALLALISGFLVFWIHGLPALGDAFQTALSDALFIIPLIILGITVGALLNILVPNEVVARHLGGQAGLRAILFSSVIGTIMPGGPFVAFPIVMALGRAGAGVGALIAFLTAWSAVGLHRLLVWEIPFMGAEFATLRFVCSLPVPILAGIAAEKLSARVKALRVEWDKLP
jgi:uncharacterized membrane protein YraQ (UPF0718 family)